MTAAIVVIYFFGMMPFYIHAVCDDATFSEGLSLVLLWPFWFVVYLVRGTLDLWQKTW